MNVCFEELLLQKAYLLNAAQRNPEALEIFKRLQHSSNPETVEKVQQAVKYIHKNHPEIMVDGDIQANFAVNKEKLKSNFPFSKLSGSYANTLVFPNLESANISYKLLQELGNIEAVGPILIGMKKPIHLLQLDSIFREIVNLVIFVLFDA